MEHEFSAMVRTMPVLLPFLEWNRLPLQTDEICIEWINDIAKQTIV